MLRVVLPFLLVVVVAFGAGNESPSFFCPMRCEGKKVYLKPGSCPVCGMYLEKTKSDDDEFQPLNTRAYRLDLETGSPWVAKKPIKFSLSPRKTADNSPVKDFVSVNAREIQLTLVNQDLSYFNILEAVRLADGRFQVEHAFLESGNFILFARFTPKNEREQIFPLAIKVEGGRPPKPKPLKEDWKKAKMVRGHQFFLKAAEILEVDHWNRFSIEATKKRTTLKLDPNQTRLTIVSEDTTQFKVLTPIEGKIEFHHRFRHAGKYRLWLETTLNGESFVVPFTLSF